jgi:hypothetical protein
MQLHAVPRRGARLVLLAALAAGWPQAAAAAVSVDLLDLFAAEDDAGGWRLEVSLEGTELTDVLLTPPGRGAITLSCADIGGGTIECDFDDPPSSAPGFASLAVLLAAYPAGPWTLDVDGSALTAAVAFGPTEPDDRVTVTSPAEGAADVSPTPTIDYSHACSNCVALGFEIWNPPAETVGLELFVFGSPPASPGSVAYADFTSNQGPKPPALPNGTYRLTASTIVGSVTTEPLVPSGSFTYTTGAIRDDDQLFTVPEPSGAAGALAALAALGCLGARSTRREPRLTSPSCARARTSSRAARPAPCCLASAWSRSRSR